MKKIFLISNLLFVFSAIVFGSVTDGPARISRTSIFFK